MIELIEVTKSYPLGAKRRIVLNNVTAAFPTTESMGILGLNGSGKSTLLRLIGGVEPADSGTIRKDVRVSWPIAFAGGVHNSLTGRENARFIARIYGESPSRIEKFTKEFTELGPYFDMPANTYSSGMRARLAFAISMACRFDCYLVDEITAVGDRRFTLRYREAFKERLANATVVMVSHNAQTIREFCTRGAILHRGELHLYNTVDEAMAAYNQYVE